MNGENIILDARINRHQAHSSRWEIRPARHMIPSSGRSPTEPRPGRGPQPGESGPSEQRGAGRSIGRRSSAVAIQSKRAGPRAGPPIRAAIEPGRNWCGRQGYTPRNADDVITVQYLSGNRAGPGSLLQRVPRRHAVKAGSLTDGCSCTRVGGGIFPAQRCPEGPRFDATLQARSDRAPSHKRRDEGAKPTTSNTTKHAKQHCTPVRPGWRNSRQMALQEAIAARGSR